MTLTLHLGTRGSKLALWQANHVRDRLLALNPGLQVELVIIKTTADAIQDRPLSSFGGQGVFVKELESALLDGRIDIAVHSLKDVPTRLADGLTLGAVLEREDPHDTLVSPQKYNLLSLPEGTVVGTSSPRRAAQILSARPDLKMKDIRGNLDTRLRKMQEGEYGCIVLAMAGLKRLAPEGIEPVPIDFEHSLPAPGQGAVAVELRGTDEWAAKLIAPLHHPHTAACVGAERSMLAALGGGCQLPVGCLGSVDSKGKVKLEGVVADREGRRLLRAHATGTGAEDVGARVAEKLRYLGADHLLRG